MKTVLPQSQVQASHEGECGVALPPPRTGAHGEGSQGGKEKIDVAVPLRRLKCLISSGEPGHRELSKGSF